MALKTINVTEQDIRKGHQNNCFLCPVARAISRVLGYGFHADVGEDEVDFRKAGARIESVDIPEVARTFIKAFDLSCDDVEPFTFELEIPEAVLNQ